MVDHSAIRNRMIQWATFLYDMHGELLWNTVAAFTNQESAGNSTDAWEQLLIAGGNGEGTLFYPGRPDMIGGTQHVPVASIRLKLIREGQEDYEYLRLAERLVGRHRVLEVMAKTMRSATNFTSDAADIFSTRLALAQLIEQATQ